MTPTTHPLVLGHIGQVSLAVSDIERSVAFYRDVLRLPYLFSAGQLAFFDCDGTRLFLDALPEAQGKGNSVIYFQVPSIEPAYRELVARGARSIAEPHMIHRHDDGTEEWMAFFVDPDDNTFALMSQRLPVGDTA